MSRSTPDPEPAFEAAEAMLLADLLVHVLDRVETERGAREKAG